MRCECTTEECQEEARYTVMVNPPQENQSVLRVCEKHKDELEELVRDVERGAFQVIY